MANPNETAIEISGPELAVEEQREISATTLAAEAEALVKAKFAMAAHRPRDIFQARARLLNECQRPGFARVARYRLPRGNKEVTGPSIRFAEAALRALGNVDISARTIYEDQTKRKVRVDVIDLETNASYSTEILVDRVQERRELRKGQQAIGTRTNSYGDLVYLVEATEGDMLTKTAAAISRAIRTTGLRLVPGDLIEEALDVCDETAAKDDAADPAAAAKRLADAFTKLGVQPDALREYIGQPFDSISPAQRLELQGLYAALREGTITWAEVMAERAEERAAGTAKGSATGKSVAERAREAIAQRAAVVTAPTAAAAESASAPAAQTQPDLTTQPAPAKATPK